MITVKKLKIQDYLTFNQLISSEGKDYKEYLQLGWSVNQIKNQLNKNVNFSYGVFYNNLLISFILGDLFHIEKSSEYEILLLYVCKNIRNKGIGSKLLKKIEETKKNNFLIKIYLEVSNKNVKAISFYKKMNFKKIYTRKNYYSIGDEKMDALVLIKNLL